MLLSTWSIAGNTWAYNIWPVQLYVLTNITFSRPFFNWLRKKLRHDEQSADATTYMFSRLNIYVLWVRYTQCNSYSLNAHTLA